MFYIVAAFVGSYVVMFITLAFGPLNRAKVIVTQGLGLALAVGMCIWIPIEQRMQAEQMRATCEAARQGKLGGPWPAFCPEAWKPAR